MRRVASVLLLSGAAVSAVAAGCTRKAPPQERVRGEPVILAADALPGVVDALQIPKLRPITAGWYREPQKEGRPAVFLSAAETEALIEALRIPPLTDDSWKDWRAARTRERAAIAVADAWGPDVVSALAYSRDRDPYWVVYRAAKRSLAKLDPNRFALPHDDEARRLAETLCKREEPPEGAEAFRRRMREYERKHGQVAVVWEVLQFAPKEEIERARKRLIVIGAPAVEPMLEVAAAQAADRVHSALVAIGGDAVPALILTLERQHYGWPRDAIRALGDIGDARALPALRRIGKHCQHRVRYLAEEAIAKIEVAGLAARGREAVPQLIAAVERQPYYPEARCAAICALGEIGDPRALAMLQRIASTPHSPYREVAKEAVAKIEAAIGG